MTQAQTVLKETVHDPRHPEWKKKRQTHGKCGHRLDHTKGHFWWKPDPLMKRNKDVVNCPACLSIVRRRGFWTPLDNPSERGM